VFFLGGGGVWGGVWWGAGVFLVVCGVGFGFFFFFFFVFCFFFFVFCFFCVFFFFFFFFFFFCVFFFFVFGVFFSFPRERVLRFAVLWGMVDSGMFRLLTRVWRELKDGFSRLVMIPFVFSDGSLGF